MELRQAWKTPPETKAGLSCRVNDLKEWIEKRKKMWQY